MGKKNTKHVNVEIAPAVLVTLEGYIEAYNAKPERSTSKLKYTDVINAALDSFFKLKGVQADAKDEKEGKQGKKDQRQDGKRAKPESKV